MANATFLFDDIVGVFERQVERKQQLDELAVLLKMECGIAVYFCRIIGARWSFVAGDRSLDIPEQRIKLNENWGLMTSKIMCSKLQWQKVLDILRDKLKA